MIEPLVLIVEDRAVRIREGYVEEQGEDKWRDCNRWMERSEDSAGMDRSGILWRVKGRLRNFSVSFGLFLPRARKLGFAREIENRWFGSGGISGRPNPLVLEIATRSDAVIPSQRLPES